MSNQEKQLAIIPDVILPIDINARYDLYFTDRRIGIVCMGSFDRFGFGMGKMRAMPSASSAVSPPLTYVDVPKEVEDELSTMPISDVLKLNKKSSQYSYSEIEELRLIWGKTPKFIILSRDCESKFTPDEAQFKQLLDLLTSIEHLSSKLKVAGNWRELQELLATVVCGNCGVENDLDAVCCTNCGQKIQELPAEEEGDVACSSCGKKNREGSAFCKQCGAALKSNKIE